MTSFTSTVPGGALKRVPRLVLFGCDGVLVDSEPLVAAADAQAVTEFCPARRGLSTEEALEIFSGRTDAAFAGLLSTYFGVEDAAGCLALRESIIRWQFLENLSAPSGLREALRTIEESGAVCAVVSNANRARIELALRCAGLSTHFDGRIYSAEDVAHGKPSSELIDFALKRSGTPLEDAVLIDDSPFGLAAARAAGVRAWGFTGFNRMGAKVEQLLVIEGAERILRSFAELEALFAPMKA